MACFVQSTHSNMNTKMFLICRQIKKKLLNLMHYYIINLFLVFVLFLVVSIFRIYSS